MRVPLYRLLAGSDHFYTTSEPERDNAISQFGYHLEGIACYVETEPAVANTALRDEICARVMAHLISIQLSGFVKAHDPMSIANAMNIIAANPDVGAAAVSIMKTVDGMLAAAVGAHTE